LSGSGEEEFIFCTARPPETKALYCADELALPVGPPSETIDTKSYLKTAYHDIPIVVPSIRDFWMPKRLTETP
jgi:hypothetical protein